MITLMNLCFCTCGNLLVTRTERADNLCTVCADAPACSHVHPTIIVEWAMAKARREAAAELLTVRRPA
jgi:hypothetical protein